MFRSLLTLFAAACLCGCARPAAMTTPEPQTTLSADDPGVPENARRWMQKLTVPTRYDPKTGFIVAQRVTPLPAVLADAPGLEATMKQSASLGKPVLVFATADRCGPCQQFKFDALNHPGVVARLSADRDAGRYLLTHIEVDREPEAARRYLGGASIPITYWLVDGRVAATLRGQRSAADLMAFLDQHR